MKKNLLSVFAVLMAALMLMGVFASCSGNSSGNTETTKQNTSESLESTQPNETESKDVEGSSTGETETSASDTSGETTEEQGTSNTDESLESSESDESESKDVESDSSDNESETTTSTEDIVGPTLSGEHADIIEYADSIKNNISMYFPDSSRDRVIYENMEMVMEYALDVTMAQQVTSLKNKAGNTYIENTMDVFVKMENGNRYYAKDSFTDAIPNIYRFGYYFYEMRSEGQTFIKDSAEVGSFDIDHTSYVSVNDGRAKKKGDVLNVINDKAVSDPYIVMSNTLAVDASIYTMLELTLKADENTSDKVDIFYIAGDQAGFNGGQRVNITIIPDGEVHTYRIPLYMGPDYYGTVKGLRFDIGGASATYEISGVRFLGVDVAGAPKDLSLCRMFNVYSDKMHQVIQIPASSETSGIEEIGIQTKIAADTVVKLVIKDKCEELHTSLDGVDWASVEYVGFDIKEAGIFGYILPYDGKGGSLRIELTDGEYIVEQVMTPANGTIIPSRTDYNEKNGYYNWVKGGNTNDFYMGSRIYTDPNHDFDEFLEEAYCERNPLSDKYIKVDTDASTSGKYVGYDSLRGIYRFELSGAPGGFSGPYYYEPNKHYRVNFTVRGDDYSRKVYILAHTVVGQLENAVLLDRNDVMIPVPLEVGKNFSEQGGERNIYNLEDATYGETIFPMVINAKEKYEYSVINLYQNWGRYPLKQLSWIQFFSPYYHLSTGVTETNCVLPWMFTDRIWYNTLPDHRGMSAPHWASQPQHTSSGEHDWLKYLDENGKEIRWENRWNTIDSYGPTYADFTMDCLTYDGKMKVSYTHTEMPQIDENRGYYEMTYEVLSDITIQNCVTDLHFYKVDPNDASGLYQKVGYLNEQNEYTVVDANLTSTPVKYVLGDNCPYFSFFDMDNHSNKDGYGNVAFLIYNSEFVIGGEKVEPRFAIVNYNDTVYITLDIEETITLKAGDKFTINAIVLPWGSQLLDDGIIDEETNNFEYTMPLPDGTLYMDKNVRDVRENSLLNPVKAIALENAEVVESVFVPKVKTLNGESCEFTLTGGYNNITVRVYGFEKHTVPVIYEKIGDEWVIYEVSSKNEEKDAHYYDGYCVHYDGDGTYSYSFVTTMDGENDRTFRVVADGNYDEWKKEVNAEEKRVDHLDLFLDGQEIYQECNSTMINLGFASKNEVIEGERVDGLDSFIRIYGAGLDAEHGEGYATVYRPMEASVGTGKYIVLKYRLPESNAEKINKFELFLSTTTNALSGECCISNINAINDGEWHIIVVDATKYGSVAFKKHFVAADDGKYYPQVLRFDFFDKRMSKESYIDIGFVGMEESFDDIVALFDGVYSATLVEGTKEFDINMSTGEIIDTTPTIPEIYVDPSSGYTEANLEFGAQIDYINGISVGLMAGSGDHFGIGGHTLLSHAIAGMDVTDSATVKGHYITLAGWCVIEGGVDSYVWSADGGKTWNKVEEYGVTPARAGEPIINGALGRSNQTVEFTVANDGANGTFQGSGGNNPTGIACNLEEYKGQTVNIIFGVIPTKAQSAIQPLFYISNVEVAE